MIKAPYNFVPISDKVFFPDWAEQISHDVPFSDGESGTIKVKMTAKSPIYVRNGSVDQNETAFSNVDGRYFIPGTSVKGMIRSVMEIMSFGKMKQVDLWTPTYRDLSPSPTGKEYKNNMRDIQCGWLKPSSVSISGYEIIDCGEPARISHTDLDEKFLNLNKSFRDLFSNVGDSNQRMNVNNDEDKSAKVKYDLFDNKEQLVQKCKIVKLRPKDNYKTAVLSASGEYNGTIVFTGQPGLRNDSANKGKHLEFVFIESGKTIDISSEVINNFKKAYRDGEKDESKDWTFWKEQLTNGQCDKIPVFFKKSGGVIQHLGLSYLYKLPYKFGIQRGIENLSENNEHFSNRPDLTECILGKIEQKNPSNPNEVDNIGAIKGRVQFSHAFAKDGTYREMSMESTVLGGPKPGYYPTYISGIKGYNSSDLRIKGRKRYPVHKQNARMCSYPGTSTTEVRFQPICAKEGKELFFECNIRFHNLNKIEIGALLASLTFYGNNNHLFHSIGLAKGLGYGKIKLTIQSIQADRLTEENCNEYMHCFLEKIESSENINWKTSESIIELFTMASEQENEEGSNAELTHMNLNPKERINEFIDAKKEERDGLPYYSQIENGVSPVKVLSPEETMKKCKQANQKRELFSSGNELVKEIALKTNSGLKAFLRELQDDDLDKMNAMIDVYPVLNTGLKKIIDAELKKEKGGLFTILKNIEKTTKRQFKV